MKTNIHPSGTVFLVITSAVVIDGKIARVGDVVEMIERDALKLLERGKARVATEHDHPDAPPAPQEDSDEDEGDTDDGAPAPEPKSKRVRKS